MHVPGHTACFAHLAANDRATYLAGLGPGDDIDHRGTTFTEPLLADLLNALRDPSTGNLQLGQAQFDSATFTGDAWFDSATFTGDAWFGSATFTGRAQFEEATFTRQAQFEAANFNHAQFKSATFTKDAVFNTATFTRTASFRRASFTGDVEFGSVTFPMEADFEAANFTRDADFEGANFSHAQFRSATFKNAWFEGVTFPEDAWFAFATFNGTACFRSATFTKNARFDSATFRVDFDCEGAHFGKDVFFQRAVFERASSFGPLVCAGRVQLSGTEFISAVVITLAARRVHCRRTRWSAISELRLRYATVDFSHAVFEYPLTIAAEIGSFALTDGRAMTEQAFAGAPDASVRIASLRGVDAAHLVLADVDLSRCLFTGAVHLDQLRLEGACVFDKVPPPAGVGRGPRFAVRRTLAEEQHWRASRSGAARGWNTGVLGAGDVGPAQLEPAYRALRKAFEDGKNEPGAADFYYGEMEMRRHDHEGTTRTERWLLHGYWALSGYGLRASRAMYWLAATMLATVLLLMGFGIAQDTPKQQLTGTIPAGGGKVTFEIDKDDPQNPRDRFTGERFEKALNVTINSVVFRSSGQDLTTAGAYIEMASRLTEPVLLGLAVLAVRNRVKR
ncbi:pentapeptide repeat-containing protein [Streptomyces sp. NPDC048484]|uniref:pentapeptide repeat-containing protein n=1 Tax=Streptomyces sp. NPDC048484 TaxID=3155146 RepID=UPI00344268A7